MSTTILLADSHTLMREGLRTLLKKQPGMEVVAEAEDGRTTVQLAQELLPDIIIIEVAMPGLNGIEATRRIIANDPGAKVVAFSMHSDRGFVAEALKAGAAAYLLKDCAFEELIRAINAVIADQTY